MAEGPTAGGESRLLVIPLSIATGLACLATLLGLIWVVLHAVDPPDIDLRLGEAFLGGYRSRWLDFAARPATLPGSTEGSLIVVLVVSGWAWIRHRDLRPGVLLVAAYTGTAATVSILKLLIGRVSPIHVYGGDATIGRSFPSSHTAKAVAVFAMIAVVVALSRRPGPVVAISIALTVAVGTAVAIGQMYLGYHWFTDLVGGAAVAGIWVSGLSLAAYRMWTEPDLIARLCRVRA